MPVRSDGRKLDQLRELRITSNYLLTAEGSALIELGNTKVLCAATVDSNLPPWLRNSGRGWVTAEYSMLPRATAERTTREVIKGKPSGRTHEIQRLIGRSLRAVVDMNALGERVVIVDCDVLQADGGTRTAAITGGYIAMVLAIQKLVQFKVLPKSPVLDYIAATSVGVVNGTPMLDLAYDEDSAAEVDMNVVMTGAGKFVELQATSEREPFDDAALIDLISLGRKGVTELLAAQRSVLESR